MHQDTENEKEIEKFSLDKKRDFNIINSNSTYSRIHIGSLDSFDITEGGVEAARQILNYLEEPKREYLLTAMDIYHNIIPNENFGGEYTALLWLCKFFLTSTDNERDLQAHLMSEETKAEFLSYPLVNSWYELLSKDDFYYLKDYLLRKYHFIENEKSDPDAKVRLRFLEDFILFNNPDRERWDKTSVNMAKFGIKLGDVIADVGSGPGYFSTKFAELVGETGHVYAIETNEKHVEFLSDHIEKYNIKNIDVIRNQSDGIGLDTSIKVDLIYMCSLYHIIYAALTRGERDLLINNIKACLKEDGRFIVVDNAMVETGDLPYHGPYIAREMIISQLWHYGFKLVEEYQYSLQRYVLEFKLREDDPRNDSRLLPPVTFYNSDSTEVLQVNSRESLVRYRMIGTSSQGYTLLGKKAARLFNEALQTGNVGAFEVAYKTYEDLIPRERIGDEYSAFQWFCKYFLVSEPEKQEMISNRYAREYFERLTKDDCTLLKRYLHVKYDLAIEDPQLASSEAEQEEQKIHEVVYEYTGHEVSFDQLNEWNEFINFNNPNRASWEKTDKMMEFLNIKKGEYVADVGCGYGNFSFKFAEFVGKRGKVYATELNDDALSYVTNIKDKYQLNIETISSELNDACLPEDSVDTIYMCSLYHAVYIASIEFVKDQFIDSLKKALRKGGRLIVVDNDITSDNVIPYFGSGIAKELVISQMKQYGFSLVEAKQFIPQRYILIFQMDE